MDALATALADILRLNTKLFRNCLDGMTDEQARMRPSSTTNSAAFVAAHLVNSRFAMLKLMGSAPTNPLEPYLEGVRGIDDVTRWPSLDEMRAAWTEASRALRARLEAVATAELDGPPAAKFPAKTMRDAVTFLVQHDSYHIGQLSLLRQPRGPAGDELPVTDADLRERLEAMSTTELLDVLRARDADEWRPEVFPAVEGILRARGIDPLLPAARSEAPPPSPEGLVRVTSLMDQMAANLCRMALQEAGIEAFVSNEHLAGASPPLGIALGFDILVQGEDAAAAREVLAALESGEAAIPLEPEPCPKCQSLDNERRAEKDRLQALGSFLLFDTPRPSVSWRTRCRQCGHVWE